MVPGRVGSGRDGFSRPHASERLDDLLGELGNGFANLRRGKWLEAQFAPVGVLPAGNDICQFVGFQLRQITEKRAINVINRKDQVTASEPFLAIEKAFELTPASGTLEKSGRQNRNKKSDGIEGFVDALLPLLAPGNGVPVLEDLKSFSGL
jgi:hypothetical protein